MTGKRVQKVAILAATMTVLAGSGSALAWEGNGNNNGWGNKQQRGCPDDYALTAKTADSALADLNGDGWVCAKTAGNSGTNYVDNISNH